MADKQLDACISEVERTFQATANVRFQLKKRQVTAVKSLLLNHDVLGVLFSKVAYQLKRWYKAKYDI